jgi:hypothetical protein
MTSTSEKAAVNILLCDGCGQPSIPGHSGARIARLEWATRFRPIHIQALFVSEAPQASAGKDIYEGAESDQSNASSFPSSAVQDYAALLDGLDIAGENFLARLNEFQRRGFYLAFLVECALASSGQSVSSREAASANSAERCASFGPTLIKRIKFSYRPKHTVVLSAALRPLVSMLEEAGLGQSLILDDGNPFELPHSGDTSARNFQSAWQSAWVRSQAAISTEEA